MPTMKIPGVNKVRAKGRVYYYHRRTGTRIKAEFGTAAFLEEIEQATRNSAGAGAARTLPGTLGALIAAYRQSPEFTTRAPATKADYLEVFDFVDGLRDMPLRQVDSAFVLGLRDRVYRKRKRRFANYVVQVLRLLFNWGRPRSMAPAQNPAAAVPLIPRPAGLAPANRPWKPYEVAAAMGSAEAGMRVAIALGYHAGFREADVIRLDWTRYDGSAIDMRQGKTGDQVWQPAGRELRAILDEARKRNLPRTTSRGRLVPASTVIVTGQRGRPYASPSAFRANFFRFIRKLEAERKVEPGLTFHGLRHTVGTEIADLGGDTRDVMATLGHRSEAAAKIYTEGADRKRRATRVVKLRERARNRKLQNSGDGPAKPS